MASHAFIPAPNTASVEMIYTVLGQVIENQFHVQASQPFTLGDLQQLRGIFNTWDNGYVNLSRAPEVLLARIRTRALDSDTSPTEDYALPVPRAGNTTGTLAPLNVTVCFKEATSTTGRSARGRIYWCGMNTGMYSGNTVNPTWAAAVITKLNRIMADLYAANPNWKLVITSYRHDKVWRATAMNFAVNNFVLVDNNLDSQRRRLTGRGRT